MRKRNPTNKDYARAKEIIYNFGSVPPSILSRGGQIDLVRICYDRIHGVPINRLPEDQLYRIAERLYRQAFDTIEGLIPGDEQILRNIRELSVAKSPKRREALDERICLQLEHYGDNSRLVKLYKVARDQLTLFS